MDTHTTSRDLTRPSVDGMLPVNRLVSKSLPKTLYKLNSSFSFDPTLPSLLV